MLDETPIPVHVLSGFLGVGKTTAIRDLLARRADRERIAVIVNEFGELGVDGALLSDCMTCVLMEVPGGCVCCTAMRDLEASVEEMLAIVAPTRLVVEPTGLARASEIVDLFRSSRFQHRFELRPVVTLVDARQDVERNYERESLYRDQVEIGDIVVLTFCDQASPERIQAAEEFVSRLSPPKLLVARASFGSLPDEVFDLSPTTETRTLGRSLPSLPVLPDGHAHAEAEGYEGRGFGHAPERVYDVDRLRALVHGLAAGTLGLTGTVVRAKGIFRTTSGWLVHEIAGGQASTGKTEYRRDNRFDVILRHGTEADFATIARLVEDALVAEGSKVLTFEEELALLRVFDRRALDELGSRLERVAPEDGEGAPGVRLRSLIETSGAREDARWVWLVSEEGMFGVGGPRPVLEQGIVFLDGPAEAPFRFVLPEEAARGHEDEVDVCRDVPGLCAVRVVTAPEETPLRESGEPETPSGRSESP